MAELTMDVLEWLLEQPHDSAVAVDDGGLSLVILDLEGNQTGAYYEIGGIPLMDTDEEEQ